MRLITESLVPSSAKAERMLGIAKEFDAELRGRGEIVPFEHLLVRLSMRVLILQFGQRWFENVCLNRSGGSDYFKISASEPDRRLATMRLCHAAECLLNSYDEPTFDAWVKRAVYSYETAIAELQALCILREAGLSVTTKPPEGVKGKDYDLSVEFGGRVIACEVKAKLETTAFRKCAIEQSIRSRAAKQLPSCSPGMIMLLVPTSWTEQSDFERSFHSVAAAVLQKNVSLCSISAFWEVIVESPETGSCIGYRILENVLQGTPKLFTRIHGNTPLTLGGQGSEWVALDGIVARVVAERQ